MMENPIEREHPGMVNSTVIETSWLHAQYVHGKDVPAWLHQMLAHIRPQTNKHYLSVVVLPACGREDSLVVMTLGDFLLWSHRHATLNIPGTRSSLSIQGGVNERGRTANEA